MNKLMRRTTVILWSVILATLFSISAHAKEASLTQDRVTRFLASFPEMRIIAVSEGLKMGSEVTASNNPIVGVMKAIKSTKLQMEARNIAERHGFSTIKEWSETGRAIGQAYLHLTVGPKGGISQKKLDQHKEAAARELDKLGFLTQKQKDKLKENLDNASEELARVPPPENLAVVKDMRAAIETAVKFPNS